MATRRRSFCGGRLVNALRLIGVFLRIGFLSETAYRANFWIQSFESALNLSMALAAVAVVFSQTNDLGGWRPVELTTLIGVYFIVLGAINVVTAPSLQKFLEDIVTGNLDYTLTKPADAQLLVSFAEVRVWRLVDIVLGAGVLSVSLTLNAERVGFVEAAQFTAAMLCSGAIVYSFWMMLATLAFWFIRVENVLQIFWAMYTAGRWPIGIYPQWLRWTLTLVVPVAFAVTVPAQAVAGRLPGTVLVGAIALAVALLAFSRWFWLKGLQRYSGASA
jgi:viologen exporter family transport system permease protein